MTSPKNNSFSQSGDDVKDNKPVRKNRTLVIIVIILGVLIVCCSTCGIISWIGSSSGTDSVKETEGDKSLQESDKKTASENNQDQDAEEEQDVFTRLGYEMVHSSTDVRYDDARMYFLLMYEVDLGNFEDTKQKIEDDVHTIVAEEGNKISLEFFDDRDALELFYKSHYGINELGRILTDDESSKIERHNIASFDGELETGPYLNTLYIFPAYIGMNEQIGELTDMKEFNP